MQRSGGLRLGFVESLTNVKRRFAAASLRLVVAISFVDSEQTGSTVYASRRCEAVRKRSVSDRLPNSLAVAAHRRDCSLAAAKDIAARRCRSLILLRVALLPTSSARAPRDPAKLESTIGEAVELVIATQRLTAQLRLDVRPTDAKVKITDSRGRVRVKYPNQSGPANHRFSCSLVDIRSTSTARFSGARCARHRRRRPARRCKLNFSFARSKFASEMNARRYRARRQPRVGAAVSGDGVV